MRVTRLTVGLGLLLSIAVQAADREKLSVTWTEFQRQMEIRHLSDSVRVLLLDGTAIKAHILRIEADGLVVNHSRSTKPWDTKVGEAKIPRPMIGRILVSGRVGKRGLIGGLIGLGAGAAITTGTWVRYQRFDPEAGVYVTAVTAILIPAGALAGYLIGRFSDRLAPEFIIRPNENPASP